jgi:hypothetical protein
LSRTKGPSGPFVAFREHPGQAAWLCEARGGNPREVERSGHDAAS